MKTNGGKDNRKFMITQMKKMFLEIHKQPLEKQHSLVNQRIEEWKNIGNKEQIDNILVVGVKAGGWLRGVRNL